MIFLHNALTDSENEIVTEAMKKQKARHIYQHYFNSSTRHWIPQDLS